MAKDKDKVTLAERVTQIKTLWGQITEGAKQKIEKAREAGEMLKDAKEQVIEAKKKGGLNWEDWITKNFVSKTTGKGITPPYARKLIAIHEGWKHVVPHLDTLPTIDAAYAKTRLGGTTSNTNKKGRPISRAKVMEELGKLHLAITPEQAVALVAALGYKAYLAPEPAATTPAAGADVIVLDNQGMPVEGNKA